MRLLTIPSLPAPEIEEVMGKVYDGARHIEDERVGYREVEGLRIELPPFGFGQKGDAAEEADAVSAKALLRVQRISASMEATMERLERLTVGL